MKLTTLLALGTFFVASAASASGGLSIDNVKQVENASQFVVTPVSIELPIAQGSIDAFVNYNAADREVVDTNRFQQSYDGQS